MEVLAHLDPDNVPLDYVMVEISVPDAVPFYAVKRPAVVLAESSRPGVPVYLVPSAIIPEETNIILFPAHPNFSAMIVSSKPFHFDDRLFKRKTSS